MLIERFELRSHAFGAVIVAFVASLATLAMAQMAKVGPQVFEWMTIGLGALTMLCIGAAAIMFAVLFWTNKG